MADIVDRLREQGEWRSDKAWDGCPIAEEAADAITRLREEIARYKLTYAEYVEATDRMNGTPCEQIRHQQEVDALREENARLRARICEAEEMLFNQARTIQSYQDAAIREGGKGD